MRLLFARIGEAYSYNTGKKMVKWSEEEIVDNIFNKFEGKKISLLAPLVRGRKGHYRELFEDIRKKGYLKSSGRWRNKRYHGKDAGGPV